MNRKFQNATAGTRNGSLNLRAARLHARISGRLTRANSYGPTQLSTPKEAPDSLWSPLRLDLLKTPLTRYREL
jgi:hypothetical protein